MDNQPKIHPKVIENHVKIVEWNTYVLNHLGLRLQKQNKPDYRSLDVYQGEFLLFHAGSAKIVPTVNAQLHRSLKLFLETYVEHLKKLPGLPLYFEFNPPKIHE